VAVDAVAHDIIVKERIARGRVSQSRSWQGRGRASQSRSWQGRGTQQVDAKGRSAFLELAEGLGLGVADREKIKISEVALG